MTTTPYILYIEDERPMRELVQHILASSGYHVSAASTGQEGIEMMRQEKPALLLLDLMMPDLNGWDIFQEMKSDEALSEIPVMVITAKVLGQEMIVVEGFPPADDYITKPFEISRLLQAVKKFMQ